MLWSCSSFGNLATFFLFFSGSPLFLPLLFVVTGKNLLSQTLAVATGGGCISSLWQGCYGQMLSWAHSLVEGLWIQTEFCCKHRSLDPVSGLHLMSTCHADLWFWALLSIFFCCLRQYSYWFPGVFCNCLSQDRDSGFLSNIPVNIFSLCPHCYSFFFLYYLFPEAVEECFIERNLNISGSKDFKPHLTFLKLSKASRLRRRVSNLV